jgi:hypothetical protein
MENEKKGLTAEIVSKQMINDTFSVKNLNKDAVHKTKNYDLFTTLTANRAISEKNRKKLLKSCKRKQIKAPILVRVSGCGNYLEIIDGQHRFNVWGELEQPIWFIIGDYSDDDIRTLNQINGHWMLDDFLHNQVQSGNESYIKFNNLIKRFASVVDDESVKSLTFTEILYIVTGYGSSTTNDFKNGLLKITDEEYETAISKCEELNKFLKEDVAPIDINYRKYLRAILDLFKSDGWDVYNSTEHLLTKLRSKKHEIDNKNYNGAKADMTYKMLIKKVFTFNAKKGSLYLRTIDAGPNKFNWEVIKLTK